jgi:hypothetical protein
MIYEPRCTICDRIISEKELEKAFELSRGVFRLEDGTMHFVTRLKPEESGTAAGDSRNDDL